MNISAKFADLKTKPKILIGVLSPMVLLLMLGGIAVFNINSITATNERVEHTHNVLSAASGIVGSAVDMETGMRGYLLAGQEGFLDPYNNGETATYAGIASLQETVSDNPGQVERLAEVERVLREWQEKVTEPTIALRRKIGDAKTMNDMAALVGEARGKVFFDKFRGQISTFIDREAKLLAERRQAFESAQNKVGEGVALIEKTGKWVDHTHNVLAAAARILAHAVDMETGMRGFLLAGEDDFLAPYNSAKTAFFESIRALQETVSDNPAQVARLKESEATIQSWVNEVTEPAIELRRQVVTGARSLGDVEALVSRKLGKKFFDAFREQIAAFSEVEQKLMEERQATAVTAEKSVASNLEIMQKNESWVTHTYKVIQHANSVLASAVDMETGMRGYLLAGKDDFLAPYDAGQKAFHDLIASLRETVSDNPAQVKLLTETEATIDEWQTKVTEPTIGLRRQIGNAKTMDDMADLIGEARGKQYFDKFRQIMADFSGEEIGLMEVRQAANVSTVNNTYMMIAICIVVALAIGVALAWLIGNGIANPIRHMTEIMQRLAKGDNEVEIAGAERADEIGDMAETVEVFKQNAIEAERLRGEQEESRKQAEKLREEQEETKRQAEEDRRNGMLQLADGFESSVKGVVELVASASTEMESTAQSMSNTAEDAQTRTSEVAAASEQASANVQTVASAAEELSSSIDEISRRVTHSAEISGKAVEAAENTNQTIRDLADAAQKIGEVVDLINDIANQTNLLALNATIEAARAGDAGKGFAVVASEVKNLASQTAQATEDISAQIGAIQGTTQEAVGAIEGIGTTISEMNDIATTIASAVEEQGAATGEISRNVQEAATGTESVNHNISNVSTASAETGESAGEVLKSAQELSQQSETLRSEVDKFLAEVRAA